MGEKLAQRSQEPISDEEQLKLDREVVENLKKYRGESILKKAAMNVLVKHMTKDQVNTL